MSVGPLLEINDLAKSFDGFFAVDGVDLAVAPATIHSVIGPNGAGKTTFFRLLTGVHRAKSWRSSASPATTSRACART